jgi:predicted Zn-dependent protease
MKRPLLAAVLALAACHQEVRRADLSGVKHEAGKVALSMGAAVKAADEAKKECAERASAPVGLAEERELGTAVSIGIAQNYKAPFLLGLTSYLAVVGGHLSGFSARPAIPWTFGVLDSPVATTISAPGGYVFVTTGLLKQLDNEAQLAGALAHEIAHVALRHRLKEAVAIQVAQCEAAVQARVLMESGLDATPELHATPSQFAHVSSLERLVDPTIEAMQMIGRGLPDSDELDADQAALEMVVFAGYDAEEYGKLLKKLPRGEGLPPIAERLNKLDAARARLAVFGTDGLKPPLPPDFK